MTLKEITFDILRLLQKSKLVDDSRLSDRHIQYKIHQYRASGIRETLQQWGEIEPVWIQSLGTKATTTTEYEVGDLPEPTPQDGILVQQPPDVTSTTTTTSDQSSVVTFTKINSADDPNI